MTISINRRQLLAGTAAIAATTSLGLPAWAQEARLRYYFWGGPGRSDRKVDTTTKFATERGGLVVDSEWSPWGDYWPRLATQISGGNAPDLIQMDYLYLAEYARRGVLLPLDEFYPSIIQADDFGDQRLQSGMVDGKLYGVTIGDNALGIGYDKQAWDAAGVEIPTLITWEGFREACRAFKAGNTDEKRFATTNWAGSDNLLEIWLRQKGKPLYTPEGQVGFDAADAAEWFEYWRTMSEEGLAAGAEETSMIAPGLEMSLLVQGYAASQPIWSNELNPITQLVPFPLEIVPLPQQTEDGASGAYLKPSQFMSISATSANPAIAAEVINYLTNSLQAFQDVGVDTAVPPSARVREEIVPSLDEVPLKSVRYVELVSERAEPLPTARPGGAGEVVQAQTDINLQLLYGSIDAEQAGQQLVQEAEAVLARANNG